MLLGFALVLYSGSSVANKLASQYPFLSWRFILFYGCGLFILFLYALLWQAVLKHFDLTVAYAAKPITTLLSMVWGVLLFQERISWNMMLGAVIIFAGIWIVVTDHG